MLSAYKTPKLLGDGSDGYSSGASSGASSMQHYHHHAKNRLVAVGVPAALVGGALTTLTFGAAFKLARTDRAWAPALLLGGITALAGLLKLAHCAGNYGSPDGAAMQAATPGSTMVVPISVSPAPSSDAYSTATPVASDDGYDDGSASDDDSGYSNDNSYAFGRYLGTFR